MNTWRDRLLPAFRALGVLVAFGVGLIPSLEVAVAASLTAFVAAWIIASIWTMTRWSMLPRSLQLLHVGMTLSVIGTIVRLVEAAVADGQLTLPSLADAIAVPGILIMLAGFWQAARARAAMQDLADILDAIVFAILPIGIVAAVTVGYLTDAATPTGERLLNGGLFAIDAVFLVVMSALVFGPGVRDKAAVWLAAGGMLVVVFDLLVFVGIALDASWRDQPLRALALAITCYAVATTYPSYVSFAQPGTREQRYRSGVYATVSVGLIALMVASATAPLASRTTVIAMTAVFLAVVGIRVYHSTLTAQRLNEVVDAESALAKELADAENANQAIDAATSICRQLLKSDAVTVALEPPEAPIVAATERVWVGSWQRPPSHLMVTFTQVAQVVDFALDSITSRNKRARELATVEATTDPTTGWRTQTSFSGQTWVKGFLAVIECPEVATLARTASRHEADALLAYLAHRLETFCTRRQPADRPSNRWRGEGWALITVVDSRSMVEELHRHLAEAEPQALADQVTPTITVGVVELDEPTDPTIGLIRARMALENGTAGSINWFSAELQERAERRWAIISCFKRSLVDPAGAGFCCHYQGIVDAATGEPVALEALVRWIHPGLGAISPGEFIPIAEQEGLVDALDRWVLDTATTHLSDFHAIIPTLKMHVNMSPAGAIAQKLESLAHTIRLQHSAYASSLVIELTETAVDERQDANLGEACQRVRDTGAGLALDDFGTGQSNLARVTRLPFSEIKLGADFARSADSARMLATMVPTIKALGLPIVAENIETEDQLERVRAAGVDHVQGYLFSKPAPFAETIGWLNQHAGRAVSEINLADNN